MRKKILLLEDSKETLFLVGCLEATMTHLGRCIDELEVDLLEGASRDLREEGFSESDDSLLGSHDATTDHDPVLVDFTIVGEPTHGSDRLLSEIVLCGGVVGVLSQSLTHSVDLLVDLSSVVETVLTGSRDGVRNSGRMPRTDTSDLSLASVSLTSENSYSPSLNHTSVTMTLGDTNHVNHLILSEDGRDRNLLLEKLGAEINFIRNRSSVDLDLDDLSLLLTDLSLGHLSVHNGSDDLAVLLSSSDLSRHLVVVGVSLGVLGEGLLLRLVPVLVETSAALITEVLSPNRGQSSETLGSLGVTDETDAHHGRGFKDGDSLSDFLLVQLRSRLLDISKNVSHSGLVTHESGQVAGLGLIILREGLDLSLEVLCSLSGKETEGTAAGMLELSM